MATEYTEEQIAEVQAIIEERQRQAAEAAAERDRLAAEAVAKLAAEQKAKEDAALASLRTWLASDCVTQAVEELDELVVEMREVPRVSPYAWNFLKALRDAAGPLPTAPAQEGDDDGAAE